MKSSQDWVPTEQLGSESALDSQGRILRRPYFLTIEEHDAEMLRAISVFDRLMKEEREAKASPFVYGKATLTISPRVRCRKRLRWLVKWLIRIG